MIKNAKHILLGVQLAVSYQVQQDELLFSSESCQLVGPTIQYVPDRVKGRKSEWKKITKTSLRWKIHIPMS